MNALTGMLETAGTSTSAAWTWFLGSFFGGYMILFLAVSIITGLIFYIVHKAKGWKGSK